MVAHHGKGFEESPATTGNGDHKAFLVEPGIYRVDIAREWDYISNMPSKVVD
jgi:hypothetical protein